MALASVSAWSSGSAMRSRPLAVLGTSSVKLHGPRPARSRTQASRAGVAAVRLATTSTRAGWAEDSMRDSLRARRPVEAECTPRERVLGPVSRGRRARTRRCRRCGRGASAGRARRGRGGREPGGRGRDGPERGASGHGRGGRRRGAPGAGAARGAALRPGGDALGGRLPGASDDAELRDEGGAATLARGRVAGEDAEADLAIGGQKDVGAVAGGAHPGGHDRLRGGELAGAPGEVLADAPGAAAGEVAGGADALCGLRAVAAGVGEVEVLRPCRRRGRARRAAGGR